MREGGSDWRSDSFSALQRQQGEKGEEVKAALLSFSCAGPPPATSGTCEDVLRPLKNRCILVRNWADFQSFYVNFFLVILPKIWSVGVSPGECFPAGTRNRPIKDKLMYIGDADIHITSAFLFLCCGPWHRLGHVLRLCLPPSLCLRKAALPYILDLACLSVAKQAHILCVHAACHSVSNGVRCGDRLNTMVPSLRCSSPLQGSPLFPSPSSGLPWQSVHACVCYLQMAEEL